MYTEFSSLGKFYFHPWALYISAEAGPICFIVSYVRRPMCKLQFIGTMFSIIPVTS